MRVLICSSDNLNEELNQQIKETRMYGETNIKRTETKTRICKEAQRHITVYTMEIAVQISETQQKKWT